MPGFDVIITFLIATSIFAYMPGPSMLYTTAQTIAGGRQAGWVATLGIHAGGYLHVFAAVLGLSIVFETIPLFYLVLKTAGAVYLVILGIRMFLSGRNKAHASPRLIEHSFFQSAMVEMLNPKTALFYLAFLPQFTDPAEAFPIWAQFLILGTIVNIMFSSADAICVIAADRISRHVKRSNPAISLMRKLGGAILVGLGLNLALSRSA